MRKIELCPKQSKGTHMSLSKKLLRIAAVSNKTTLAKSTIWLKVSQNKFPKPIKLSGTINVWMESDIDSWINSHVQKPLDTEQTLPPKASLSQPIGYELHPQGLDETNHSGTRS